VTSGEANLPMPGPSLTSEASPGRAVDVAASLTSRLEVLGGLDTQPLDAHADVYQQLHAELQAALAEIDSA
jgi:hypothetical protein